MLPCRRKARCFDCVSGLPVSVPLNGKARRNLYIGLATHVVSSQREGGNSGIGVNELCSKTLISQEKDVDNSMVPVQC